jgi:hypothetical protein
MNNILSVISFMFYLAIMEFTVMGGKLLAKL